MKTYKLTVATMLALALIALTTAMLVAAPTKPGKELRTELGNAPIPPRTNLKAHSDEWNNNYFDRNVATTLPFYFERISRGQMRGGLAGRLPSDMAKPIVPKPGAKAHSDSWDAYYFDGNVNTTITSHGSEFLRPGMRRGGLAKGAATFDN